MICGSAEYVFRVHFQLLMPERGTVTKNAEHWIICSASQGYSLKLWGKSNGLFFNLLLLDLVATFETAEIFSLNSFLSLTLPSQDSQ